MKYKKSINCKKPRGFSQKQHCKYGRTKKRVKKTLKGGVGERLIETVLAKGAMQIGRGAVNMATGVGHEVIKDATKQELFGSKYSKKFSQNENVNPNFQFYDENKENNMNIGNRYRGVDNSKFPILSPKDSSPRISPPPENLFDNF